MLLKIGAVLAAIPLSLVAVVAGTGVVVVDVNQAGPDGHHIVVPVPLLLAESAAVFVPEKARHVDLHQAKPYLPVAEAALADNRRHIELAIRDLPADSFGRAFVPEFLGFYGFPGTGLGFGGYALPLAAGDYATVQSLARASIKRIDQLKKDGKKSVLLLVSNGDGEVRFVALNVK